MYVTKHANSSQITCIPLVILSFLSDFVEYASKWTQKVYAFEISIPANSIYFAKEWRRAELLRVKLQELLRDQSIWIPKIEV